MRRECDKERTLDRDALIAVMEAEGVAMDGASIAVCSTISHKKTIEHELEE